MRRLTVILIVILALVWWARAHAQAGDTAGDVPVVLTDEQGKYPLGLHMELLEDPGGDLTIEDISSPEFDSRFMPSQVEAPNYGFTKSVYWVRLRLRNEALLTDRWFLDVGFANMHFVELYTPLANGDGFEVKQTGSMRSPDTRDILHPRIVLNLTIPSQSLSTVYLRFQNGAPMILPITLWQPDAFADNALEEQLVTGVFFGVVLGLLFYHLFLFISLREAPHLYLVLLLIGVAAYEASQANYLDLYLIPTAYQLKRYIIAFATALILISIVLLHDSFLTAKKLFPNIYRMDMVLIGIWGVLALWTFFTDYHDLAIVMSPMIVVTLSASSIALIAAWPRGFRANRALIIALLGLFASILLFILGRLGVISNVTITENLFRVGFVSLAVCWSLALAERVNNLKSETEQANLELRSSERRLAQILEGLPLGVVVYGKDQKPSFSNRRVAEILGNPARGIEPDIGAGRTLAEAMQYYSFRIEGSDQEYPVERLPVYRALQGQAASADDAEADLVDRRVPLEIWASPVMDDAGNVEAAVVAFQDITDRKQAETALRASEKKFRVVVENNFDGVVFMARDRQVLYVSPTYERLNGMSAKDMIGQSGVNFVHPEDRARIAEVFAELLQRPGGKVVTEYRSRHRDGSWFWVETNAVNLLDDPRVRAVVLNIRDISERRRTESELAAHREHLEGLVEERTEELRAANQRLSREIVEREKLEQLLYQHLEWLTVLNEIRHSITGTADLPRAYENLSASILELLEAQAVFIVRWAGPVKPIEAVGHIRQDDSVRELKGIAPIFDNNSTLRKKIELGQMIILAAEQVTTLPAPLGATLQGDYGLNLLLAPILVDQSVSGVFGVTVSQTMQDFARAQDELIETISLDLADLVEDAQLLDQAQALIANEERNRLARDLHDSVTQVLFSASLVAEVLPQIWRRDPERALRSIEELRRLTRGALAEMRTLLLELRPNSVLRTPLPELLAQLTEAVTARIELPFQLFIEQTPPLPEEVHISFYRIAQEALNNVVKHAQAGQVMVSLSATPITSDSTGTVRHKVKLVIEDDGVGFSSGLARQEHLGFGIMRERASSIRAALSVNSLPGTGTKVTLIWPGKQEHES